ncbi:MAG: N(4)-(beta-N-acetylglucosaminyl)-L-asparaginase [Gemmataceae bacterium]
MAEPIVIATWPFGKVAVELALKQIAAGKPVLDAVIDGATAVEDDITVRSVGFGSVADRIGRVTLDACVMDGKTLSCGSVAALEHIRSAAKVARMVMEKTPHIQIFGEGAKWFALQNGFPLEMPHTLESIRDWYNGHPDKAKWKDKPPVKGVPISTDAQQEISERNHDTVTVIGQGPDGRLGGVCTTSGLSYKVPGRVGDSPIIGAGLYVDDEVGAAGATGTGEEIIRIGGASYVIEQLRAGKSPQEACEMACLRANKTAARRGVHPVNVAFLAMDPKGRVGGACTARTNFQYAVGKAGKVELVTAKEVSATM